MVRCLRSYYVDGQRGRRVLYTFRIGGRGLPGAILAISYLNVHVVHESKITCSALLSGRVLRCRHRAFRKIAVQSAYMRIEVASTRAC
jgi:hypothetical protein